MAKTIGSFSCTPSGTRLRYLKQAVVCSILTFPLNPPLTKGDLSGFSSYNIQQKNPMEKPSDLCSTPSGTTIIIVIHCLIKR